jgi:hypothetical protein
MFDNISFKLENFSRNQFDNLVADNIDSGFINRDISFGKERHMISWGNLRLEYFPSKRTIWIKNSIHKFYNSQIANWGEYNHDDYTYEKFVETVDFFCGVLNCYPKDLKLFGKFEYGLNVTLKYRPFEIANRFESIVTTASNPFYTVPNKHGKPFERICHFTNYAVKFYDKSKQAQISGKILRYEIASNKVSEIRKLFGIKPDSSATFATLLDKKNWEKCLGKLIDTYHLIRKIPLAKNLTPTEYASVKAFTDPVFMKDHRIILNNDKLYNKVLQNCKDTYYDVLERKGAFFTELRLSFEKKYEELITSKNVDISQKKVQGLNISLDIRINPILS